MEENLTKSSRKDIREEQTSRYFNSKLDNLSGVHTRNVIIAVLFFLVLTCYTVVICIKTKIDPVFHTSMISIMTLLVGCFGRSTELKKGSKYR
jgi:hypothetical protein